MNTRVAYGAGIGWASIFGLSFLVTKGALSAFRPEELLFLRFALATLSLGLLGVLGVVSFSFAGKPKGPLFLMCLFQPIIYFTCETLGLQRISSISAGLILGALPAVVAALSVPALRERLRPLQWVGLGLSVLGLTFVIGIPGRQVDGGGDSPAGILLILAALLSAAFYNVFSRRASRWYSPAESTFAMMASGAVVFGLITLISSLARGDWSMVERGTAQAWGAIAYLGLLSSVLAFFLINLTLAQLPASRSAVFATLVPLVSLLAGILVGGDRATLSTWLGAGGILVGVWITNAAGAAG